MKSMCKHWGLHISTNINCLGTFLGSFWVVWRGLLWCLKEKLRSWQFLRYWWFNKWYYGGYQLICLISWPLLISSRHDWYQSKGLFKGFWVPLRLYESLKNWQRYGQMKFVTLPLLLLKLQIGPQISSPPTPIPIKPPFHQTRDFEEILKPTLDYILPFFNEMRKTKVWRKEQQYHLVWEWFRKLEDKILEIEKEDHMITAKE